MVILNEEKQRLNEMATVCSKDDGYGMVIEVYSEAHGIIGNKSNPAHAHLKTTDQKYLGKFAITDQPPRDSIYVFDCDKNKLISSDFKKKIAKWAKDKYQGSAVTNWFILKTLWNSLHPR
jgi:hypothetical protein